MQFVIIKTMSVYVVRCNSINEYVSNYIGSIYSTYEKAYYHLEQLFLRTLDELHECDEEYWTEDAEPTEKYKELKVNLIQMLRKLFMSSPSSSLQKGKIIYFHISSLSFVEKLPSNEIKDYYWNCYYILSISYFEVDKDDEF